MFCIEAQKHLKPWYVGMTSAIGGFRSEIFQEHKLSIYNKLMEKRRGKPLMFLFPLMTPSGVFSKSRVSKKNTIEWLERYLMMTAFARNPDIANIRDMRFLRQVEVLGILGKRQGRPYSEVKAVRRALFGTSSYLEAIDEA